MGGIKKGEMNSALARDAGWYAKLPKVKLTDKALWSTIHCLLHQRRDDGSAPVVLETEGVFYKLPPLYDAVLELCLRHTHKGGSLPKTATTLQGLAQQQVLEALRTPGRYVPGTDGSVVELKPATAEEGTGEEDSSAPDALLASDALPDGALPASDALPDGALPASDALPDGALPASDALAPDGALLVSAGSPISDSELGTKQLDQPEALGECQDIGSADAAEHPRGPEIGYASHNEPAQSHKRADAEQPQAALDAPMFSDTAEQPCKPDADSATTQPNTSACSCQSPSIPTPLPTATSVQPGAESESSAVEATPRQEAPRADGTALISGNVDSVQLHRKSKRKEKRRRKHR
jgi:hypothetical protein